MSMDKCRVIFDVEKTDFCSFASLLCGLSKEEQEELWAKIDGEDCCVDDSVWENLKEERPKFKILLSALALSVAHQNKK